MQKTNSEVTEAINRLLIYLINLQQFWYCNVPLLPVQSSKMLQHYDTVKLKQKTTSQQVAFYASETSTAPKRSSIVVQYIYLFIRLFVYSSIYGTQRKGRGERKKKEGRLVYRKAGHLNSVDIFMHHYYCCGFQLFFFFVHFFTER